MKNVLGAHFISYTPFKKDSAATDTHGGKRHIPLGAAVGLH
jgi:hypothetical protein